MNSIDFTELQEKLDYDSLTGQFTWKVRVSNSVKPGMVAGARNNKGYLQIRIGNGQRIFAHKLAWFWVYGVMPDGVIDHINGIPDDNRIANLRVVTIAENAHNQRRPHSRTTSGYLGVTWVARCKKWQAGLGVNGKFKFLGLFDDPKLAHEAYLEGKRIHHPSAPVH